MSEPAPKKRPKHRIDARPAVEAAIREHMATQGSHNWNDLFAKFPDVSHGSMWRWIREIKDGPKDSKSMINARARLAQKLKSDVAKQLPMAPAPEYIARAGMRAMDNLDFVVEIKRLYGDANMLRAMAVAPDPLDPSKERIKNPAVFDKSIQRRADLLMSSLAAIREIWDLRTMQRFYQIVLRAIGECDLETQKRILERLAAVNAEHGMTMDMRV